MPDTVMIESSWDSGPYSTFSESDAKEPVIDEPGGYGTNVVPVPRAIWERYAAARDELDAAEEALKDAEHAYLEAARATDPRWLEARAKTTG